MEHVKSTFRALTVYLLCALAAAAATGQPKVVLKAPVLGEGMDYVQANLDTSMTDFSDDVQGLVNDTLNKPAFMEGFGSAASRVVLVPTVPHHASGFRISLGSAAALYSEDLSPEMVSRLSNLSIESDEKTGACIQPLVISFAFPIPLTRDRVHAAASVGWMEAEASEYGVKAFSGGGTISATVFKPVGRKIVWDGLVLSAGGDYARNEVTARIKPGVIRQTVEIDPDDDGPLVAMTATISLNPDIRAGVESSVTAGKAYMSTGATFFEALSVSVGAGYTAGLARAAILLDTDETVDVEGYLANLISEPGSVSIHGTASETWTKTRFPWVQASLGWNIGPFRIVLPVAYTPEDGIGTGFFLEALF